MSSLQLLITRCSFQASFSQPSYCWPSYWRSSPVNPQPDWEYRTHIAHNSSCIFRRSTCFMSESEGVNDATLVEGVDVDGVCACFCLLFRLSRILRFFERARSCSFRWSHVSFSRKVNNQNNISLYKLLFLLPSLRRFQSPSKHGQDISLKSKIMSKISNRFRVPIENVVRGDLDLLPVILRSFDALKLIIFFIEIYICND